MLGLSCCTGFSLVTESGSYSLFAMLGLLTVVLLLGSVGSIGPEGFCNWGVWAQWLCGSWALEHRLVLVEHGLSCSTACGIFPDQDLNLCPLHWQVDSLPLSHQGREAAPLFSLYFICTYCITVITLYLMHVFEWDLRSNLFNFWFPHMEHSAF